MPLWSSVSSWYRNTFHRARVERVLDEELRAYLALLVAEKVRAGMAPDVAHRAALLEVGGIEQVKEEVRDVRAGAWLEGLVRDLRYAMRALARRRSFTAVAALSLGLGIGAAASIASLTHGLYLTRLPFPEPDRLVHVYATRPQRTEYYPFSYVDYTYFREHGQSLSALAASYSAPLHLAYDDESMAIIGSVASPDYFDVLQVRPARGRFFARGEGRTPLGDAVVVISDRLWRNQFRGDEHVVGRAIRLNGVSFTVIGVAPPQLVGTEFGRAESSVWMLSSMFRVGYKYCDGLAPGCEIVRLIGRLAPGVQSSQVQAELSALSRQLEAAYPETNRGHGVVVMPARGTDPERQAESTRTVALLGAAVVLLLLIVCANLAGLLLARNLARARETAVRLSLGASRMRIVRELLTESVLLGFLGAALGIGVARLGNAVIQNFYQFDYAGRRTYFEVGLDPAVLAVVLAVTLGTVVAFGLVPALRASRTDLLATIHAEGQSPSVRRSGLRDMLVVAQVALSLVLLIDATLLVRSLRHVYAGEGFDPSKVVMLRLRPTLIGYDLSRGRAFQQEVHRRLEATPGVISASPAEYPANQGNNSVTVWLPGAVPADQRAAPQFPTNRVGPRFFKTLGVRPVAGREFDERDGEGKPPVAIVNRALARRFWASGDAVGQRIVVDGVESEVVGVVPDLEYRDAGRAAEPFVYQSFWQANPHDAWFAESRTHVLVSGDPHIMVPRLRRVVADVDPDVPVSEDQTLLDRLSFEFRPVRTAVTVMTGFGIMAALLSAFGLYGVLAFRVAQRTREIGVRMALGASRRQVRRLVLRRGARLAITGSLIGLAAALASVRLLRSLLYGVSASDPLTFALATLLLLGIALLASYLPARQASRLDPLRALRHE